MLLWRTGKSCASRWCGQTLFTRQHGSNKYWIQRIILHSQCSNTNVRRHSWLLTGQLFPRPEILTAHKIKEHKRHFGLTSCWSHYRLQSRSWAAFFGQSRAICYCEFRSMLSSDLTVACSEKPCRYCLRTIKGSRMVCWASYWQPPICPNIKSTPPTTAIRNDQSGV